MEVERNNPAYVSFVAIFCTNIQKYHRSIVIDGTFHYGIKAGDTI